MRYVVTGGAGFIGSHLVAALVDRGDDVVVLDDFSTGHRENLAPWSSRIVVIEGSITDLATCARAMQGAAYVLHQAALPSVPRSIIDPVLSHAVNATGTLNVLVAARDAGVRRVVYASSSSVYGDTPELPKRETMLPRPRSPYAVAKLAGEQYCHAFSTSYGVETVALRYFNVFGPRQDPSSPYSGVVARFLQAATRGETPTITGDGEQTRDFTYVTNVVMANLLACSSPAAVGRACNIGFGSRVSLNDLWSRVRALAGTSATPIYLPPRAGDVRDSLADTDLACELLGYAPLIDLDEGLARTMRHFTGSSLA
ncbi:MAG: SDR family oxidoreductase [Gemmatimonadota bacterium]|nr:SDR family oxidoreductase [Gemmatimonadota bacterium]